MATMRWAISLSELNRNTMFLRGQYVGLTCWAVVSPLCQPQSPLTTCFCVSSCTKVRLHNGRNNHYDSSKCLPLTTASPIDTALLYSCVMAGHSVADLASNEAVLLWIVWHQERRFIMSSASTPHHRTFHPLMLSYTPKLGLLCLCNIWYRIQGTCSYVMQGDDDHNERGWLLLVVDSCSWVSCWQ